MKKLILSLICFFSITNSFAQKPKAVFGKLTSEGPYSRGEILVQEKKINVISDTNKNYSVAQYLLTINYKSGKTASYPGLGNKLSPKMIAAINQIIEDDQIVIDSIYTTVNNDSNHLEKLNSISMLVKKSKIYDPYDSKNTLPHPSRIDSTLYARFGQLISNGWPVSKEDILTQEELEIVSEGELSYTITRFKMIIAYSNRPPIMMSSSSNLITKRMLESLNSIGSGDRLLIEGIKAETIKNGELLEVNLSPILFDIE